MSKNLKKHLIVVNTALYYWFNDYRNSLRGRTRLERLGQPSVAAAAYALTAIHNERRSLISRLAHIQERIFAYKARSSGLVVNLGRCDPV